MSCGAIVPLETLRSGVEGQRVGGEAGLGGRGGGGAEAVLVAAAVVCSNLPGHLGPPARPPHRGRGQGRQRRPGHPCNIQQSGSYLLVAHSATL